MKCNFQVGQKVVCVSNDMTFATEFEILNAVDMPVVGKIYTVRSILHDSFTDLVGIEVDEIPDQWVSARKCGVLGRGKVHFSAGMFRPLVTRKTDISVFTALLTPSKEQVSA